MQAGPGRQKLGDGLDYGSYLRLRRQGSQMGGFAYVHAETGLVNLRLQLTEAELNDLGASHARPCGRATTRIASTSASSTKQA
ncbi:hypothetical protein [Streptomyces lunaelactis]|uniref:hypothetical protein n=1 Tax=Streptomyces lunaelactis TaxID=1535768 RepID=UPI00131F0DEE|nr:hypothetical protein [Streptomyces lunaelactis]NUK85840.1 hypothetical protein [Streptomyces lunaelactis]NUL03532.1 hypothetical protein [Streptomyces lunaelactis]